MEKKRLAALIVMISVQALMCVLHAYYVIYFVIMGFLSILAMISEIAGAPIVLIPLFLLAAYPVTAILSIAAAWIIFFKRKRNLAPNIVSLCPALHLLLILLSYGFLV